MILQGANLIDRSRGLVEFTVTAYHRERVAIELSTEHKKIILPMEAIGTNLYRARYAGLPGEKIFYKFQLDKEGPYPDPQQLSTRRDPWSSAVIDHEQRRWQDQGWPGLNRETQ